MLWLAALAATVAQADSPASDATPLRQARASVRIVRATPVRFQEIEKQAPASLRTAKIRTSTGEPREARLLEFQ